MITIRDIEISRFRSIRDAKLADLGHTPAVVLFKYESGKTPINMLHIEPVYNLETANPDDSPVIRAHDLGQRNAEIYRYYAMQNPPRFFYRYDLSTGDLVELGDARNLAKGR